MRVSLTPTLSRLRERESRRRDFQTTLPPAREGGARPRASGDGRARAGGGSFRRFRQRFDPLRCRAVAAAGRRLQDEDIARRNMALVHRGHFVAAAIGPLDPVAPARAGGTARDPVGRHDAVVREDDDLHVLEKADAAQGARTAGVTPGAAAAVADSETLQQHRIAPFQDFGVGEARIGHMRVHRGRAVEVGPGAGAAADRLVVLVTGVAEGDVVHRALACRLHAEGAEQRVGDRLAGLDIAGHHGGRIFRRQHRAFRDDDLDRLQAAFVQRYAVVDQAAEDVQYGRTSDSGGRVVVRRPLIAGAGKIDNGRTILLIEGDFHFYFSAFVHRIGEFAVLHHVDDAADLLFRVVLYVPHVCMHDVEAELIDHLPDFLYAFLAGGDLGLQVGDVMVRIARRIGMVGEMVAEFVLQECALVDEFEIVEQDAFFLDDLAVGGHRARRDAADIGVMAAAGNEEQDILAVVAEDRGDDGDVGQVGAAVIGRIDHEDVARLHLAGVLADDRADALAHRAQMDRDVRRVGHQHAVRIEDRAGEVEPLLDVHGEGRVLQGQPHLLGDRHEQVVEHLEHDGIAFGADRIGPLQRHDPVEDEMALRGKLGAPAGLDDGGGGLLADDRGTGDRGSRREGVAVVDGRRVLLPGHEGRDLRQSPRIGGIGVGDLLLVGLRHHADGLDRRGFDDQAFLGHDEAVALAVGVLEALLHHRRGRDIDQMRRVRAFVAQMGAAQHFDLGIGDALARQLRRGFRAQLVEDARERVHGAVFETGLDRALAHRPDVRQAHAIGGENACKGVDQDLGHAERVGDEAGMLAAGTAETVQGVAGDVVAPLHRDFLDRVRHVLDRDLQIAVGDLDRTSAIAGGVVNLLCQRLELLVHRRGVKRRVLMRTEDVGEEVRLQLAEHDVAVGHRQRTAATVAGGAGIGARALRPDPVAGSVEETDRAAARRDRVDHHHRRPHAHAGHQRLEGALVFAVVVSHVRRGPAHVEGDDALEPRLGRGLDRADDAARGARQDGVLALKQMGVGQPAVRLHEHQPRVAEL